MKDRDRIPPLLAHLAFLWKANPELRLGQLLINLCFEGEDLWLLEDDVLIKRIQQAFKSQNLDKSKLTDA